MLHSAMRNRLSLYYFLLALSCFIPSAKAAFEFRLGAVLSRRGETGEMKDARRGYKLFFDMANAKHMDSDFMMLGGGNGSAKFRMTYKFLWTDDNSNETTHIAKFEKLIKRKKLTFLLGSHPNYAAQEMEISNRHNRLNFQCCVGPDSFYEDHNYERVFGMHVSNGRYVAATMRKLSLEKVQKLWILVDESSNFTRTTCEAALDVETFEGNVSENMKEGFKYEKLPKPESGASFFEGFAERAKNNSVEAIIACVLKPDGKTLVEAFHNISYPLKAFFLTVGPTSREWIDNFSNNVSDSLLSAAQWHKDMLYNDSFFGSAAQYAKDYKEEYGMEPSYVSASASATGLVLHYAIKEAFKDCDLSYTNGNLHKLLRNKKAIMCDDDNNLTGYERVVEALKKTNRKIFFGKVKFNRFRRNVGNIPVTTQVFRDEDNPGDSESSPIMAVLPLKHATASEFRFPAKNHYEKECKPGQYIDDTFFYNRCQPCKMGSYSYEINSTDCDSCPFGKYIDKEGEHKCKECPSGTNTSQIGSTTRQGCVCMRGYYNLSPNGGKKCQECPYGAICEGGTTLPYPQECFWMNETWPDAAYPCDPGSVCLGNFTCRSGNTGRLCAECEDGYYSIIHRCYECPRELFVVVLLIALLTLWYLINVVISRSIASLEMLLDWAQLANIIGDIDLSWPPRLLKMFGIASVLDFDVDILEPSCLMRTWGFRENLSVQLFLPLFITLLAVVGYFLSKLVFFLVKRDFLRLDEENSKRLSWFVTIPNSGKDLSRKWDRVVATFFTFVNVTYITLTKYCLDAFKCQTIAGENVLSASPSVVCNTKQHDEIVALGVIGISVYVVGYGGYTTWTLFYLRKNEAFHKEKYICRYGFMYQNFEVRCFLSPIFILIQKLLFVIVLVFFNEPVFQIGALVMIIIASLMIQVSTNPYLETKNDILVTLLLVTLMFEAFGGLMLYNNSLSDEDSTVLEWIILTALLLLFLVFLVIFIIELSNKYYIHLVKVYQRAFVAGGRGTDLALTCSVTESERDAGNYETSVSFGGTFNEGRHQSGLLQLVDTFKPLYVYKCMQTDPDFTEDWDRLTNLYSGFISRHSSASYWSLRPSAKFWRRMVNQFPEIVDFLAIADDETLAQFNEIAKRLYKDFFLTNQVHPLPLMTLLNWRDRAPMAHWLSVASKEDKQLFLRTTERMLATIGYQHASDSMHAKIQLRGRNVFLKERIASRHIRRKQHRNMQLIASGSSPLDRPSIDNTKQSFRHELEMRKQDVSAFASGPRIAMSNEALVLDAVPENIESIEENADADREPLLGSWSENLANTRHTHYEEVNRTYSAGCT